MPRFSLLSSLAYFLCCFFEPAHACGGLVHGEIAQRSRALFSRQYDPVNLTYPDPYYTAIAKWLENNDGAVLAGSFMPDWGYGCSGADDLAELMHWPPFLGAAVEYVRETYPDPQNNPQVQALIAFLFAVTGHQVQDAAWHSIGLLMGFIDEVAQVDCKNSYSESHQVCDWGGDAIFSKRFTGGGRGEGNWAFGQWVVPVEDLAAIYKRMGKTVNTWQMKYCIFRLRTALIADVRGGALLFERYGKKSPFLLDYFDEYYLGGIDDMTCASVECWTNLVSWFKIGDIGDPWDLCPLTSAIMRRTEGIPEAQPCIPNIVGRNLTSEEKLVMQHLQAEDKDGVFKIWYTGPEWDEALHEDTHKDRESNPEPSLTYYGHASFARYGQSIAVGEFGIGNPFQLAIAAPFHSVEGHAPHVGMIDFLSMVPNDITPTSHISFRPSLSITPQREYEMTGLRFGFAISPLKLQLSYDIRVNVTCLVVGVPGWHHGGSLHIYSTSADYGTHSLLLEIKPFQPTWHKAYYGKRQFASKLFVADLDGDGKDDLLVLNPWTDYMGAPILPEPPLNNDADEWMRDEVKDPQRGNIAVFMGRQLEMMIDDDGYVLDEDCAFWLNPPNGDGRERFGTSIAFAKKAGLLLVGEPGAGRNSTVSGHGKVYGIEVTSGEAKIVFSLVGPPQTADSLPDEFGGGGLATGITARGTEWIAIAAHNRDIEQHAQAGVIEIYTVLNSRLNSSFYYIEHRITLHAEEPQTFGKFGTVAVSDGKDMLWISSPWANEEAGILWSYNVSEGLSRRSSQQPYFQISNQQQSIFQKINETAKVFAYGTEPKARFGASLVVEDMNGDGIADIAVSSPFSHGRDQAYPLSGKVEVFFIDSNL